MNSEADRDRILKEAFGYHRALVTYALALLRDHALAEDAVQGAYVTVARKYESFELGRAVLPWCRGIVRFEVLKILQKQGREIATEDTFLFDSVSDAFEMAQTPDREAIRTERREQLRLCLDRLPERSQKLLRDRYLERMGLGNLAQRHQMTVDAVRKCIYRVRGLLRECMNREPIPTP